MFAATLNDRVIATRLDTMPDTVRLTEGESNMNHKLLCTMGFLVLSTQLLGCERTVSYAADIQPIFREHCIECHRTAGEGVAASGFSVQDYASVMKGTSFGPVVVPGSSASSTLYLVVAGQTAPEIHMPPHHTESLAEGRGTHLPQEHVDNIAAWIDQGAQNN